MRERSGVEIMVRLLAGIHLDYYLLVGILILGGAGLMVLYSAGGEDTGLLFRHSIRFGVGLTVMLVIAQIPPMWLRLLAPWAFLGATVLLVAVLITGEVGGGAQRWLNLGFVRFQPSEIMKLAMPMALAAYLHDRPLPPNALRLSVLLVMIAVPSVLIYQQPDLGTALLVAASGILVVFLAGLSWRLIGGAVIAAIPAGMVLWRFMHEYQRQRVLTFLDPESDPLGAGYHIIQSKIAIGSGGLFGKGWLNGTQAQLEFLPERSTDFIFAVMGEEFGLLGLTALMLLYLLVVARGLIIAAQGQDTFGRLLAGSIALTFFVYVFVNTGMVTGLLPVVGVPLPLISYGGTSMVTLMAGFGILMSIQTHRKLMAT